MAQEMDRIKNDISLTNFHQGSLILSGSHRRKAEAFSKEKYENEIEYSHSLQNASGKVEESRANRCGRPDTTALTDRLPSF